jgi:hypothetical protein
MWMKIIKIMNGKTHGSARKLYDDIVLSTWFRADKQDIAAELFLGGLINIVEDRDAEIERLRDKIDLYETQIREMRNEKN